MRLYHVPGSRSTRVLWVLEEVGEPYDLTLLTYEEKNGDEHRERHPLNRVPVAEDGEGFLFESAALALHVADCYPDAGLIPPVGTHERGLVYQWVLFAMTELEPAVVQAIGDDEAAARRGRERFATAARAVDQTLASRTFLVGDRFTVADVVVGGVLGFAARNGMLEGLQHAAAYTERLNDRPARQRAAAIGR
jgi:glutathione S-transferase